MKTVPAEQVDQRTEPSDSNGGGADANPLTHNRPVEGRKAGSEPCRATL